MICFHCGSKIDLPGKPGRESTCAGCGRFLHCCRNCRFFDEAVYHQCRETEAEWVLDKESGNFCDYFAPSERPVAKQSREEEARKKLDRLFPESGT